MAAISPRITLKQALLVGTALTGMLAASAANAFNECGVQIGIVVTCAAGPYLNGITYVPSTPLTLNTAPGVEITGATEDAGIYVGGLAPLVGVETDVTIDNQGTIDPATAFTGIYGSVGAPTRASAHWLSSTAAR